MPPLLRRLLVVALCLVLLVVAVAGGALALLVARPDLLKGQVERLAGAAVGAPVRIAGPLGVDLGRVATLTAEGVAVDAPEWAASPTLASVGRLLVSVDLAAYLRGDGLVLPEVRLEAPEAALERDAQGRTSWPSPAADDGAGEPAADGGEAVGAGLPRIGDLTITDGEVAYRDAASGVALAATVATVAPEAGAAGGGRDFGGLALDGRGEVRGDPLAFSLRVGSPLLLARAPGAPGAGEPFPISGDLDLAGAEVALDGGARDPLALRGLDLALRLDADDPAKLLALLGVAGTAPPPRGLAAEARLARGDAGAFELRGLEARWGETRLGGDLAYDAGAEPRPTLSGRLHAPLLDLAALAPALSGGPAGPGPADDGAGPGAALAAYDGRLSLTADLVRPPAPAPELRAVALDAALAGGALTLDPVRVGLGGPEGGALEGRAEVADVAAAAPEAAVRLEARAVDLAPLRPFLPEAARADLAGRFSGVLEGTARGGADAAAALAGSDLALTSAFDGLRYRGLAPAEARFGARLAGGGLTLDPLRLDLGRGRGTLTGDAAVADLAAAAPEATLDLDAEALALGPLLAALAPGAAEGLAGAFTGSLEGTLRGADAGAVLAGSDVTLAGSFAGLRARDLAADEASFTARLADGALTLDPLRVALPQGRVSGTAKLADAAAAARGEPPAVALDLDAEGVDLAALLGPGPGVGGVLAGGLEGTLRGTDPAAILARGELAFAGRVERPTLPRLGDRLGPLAIEARLRPPGGGGGEGRQLAATATGTVGDEPLRLEVGADDLANLLAGKGSFPAGLRAAVGETRAAADGTLALPLATGNVDAALTLEGPGTAPVLELLGAPAVELPPYRVAGNLTRRGEAYRVRGLEGRVGDSDVAGELGVDLAGPRPRVTGDLRSRVLDIDDLGGLVGAEPATGPGETASPEQRADASAEARDADVLPDEPLDTSRWRSLDLDVRLAAAEVRAGRVPLDGFEARAALDAGRLRVEPLRLRLGEGAAAGWVALDASREGAAPGASLDLDLSRLPLGRLLSRLEVDTSALGTLSGRARGGAELGGRGYSVAEILGAADGELTLLVEGGTLNQRLVTALGFDLLRLLGSVLGTAPQEVRLACAIADLAVRDGVVTTRSLALDTAVADIAGEGTIDLGSERIDLALVADPKGVAVPGGRTGISVGGTLADPRISLNPVRLLARGAAAATLGVFLSPLTRLADAVGVDEQARRRAGPCAALLDDVPGAESGAGPAQNR